MESQIFGFLFITVVCAYSCASLPTKGRREEDIHKLVSLLGKLKNMERVRQQQFHHSHHLTKQQQQLLSGVSLSSRHSPASSSSAGFVSPGDHSALKALASGAADFPTEAFTSPDVTNSLLLGQDESGDLDLDMADGSAAGLLGGRSSGGRGSGSINEKSKRQGAWSYDYGLGGGRFGKRSYGDYGIGGGRYGRDVDHVDISDTSDADASTL